MSTSSDYLDVKKQGAGVLSGLSHVGSSNSTPGAGTASQHALDGPEHVESTFNDRLLADVGHSGLMAPLSGEETEFWRGDGTWAAIEATDVDIDDVGGIETTDPQIGDRLRFDGTDWVDSRLAWQPIMVNDPSIVTTTGEPIWVPLVTTEGQPIMVEDVT